MTLLLLFAAVAGVPIDLPEGEDRADWGNALELAQLTWSESATLRVVAEDGEWVIRLQTPDGSERTLRFARPSTEEEREAFAFLARGFARELDLVRDPSALAALPAPPPPPPRLPPGPARPAPEPEEPVVRPEPSRPKPAPPAPPVRPDPVAPPEPQPPEDPPAPSLPTVALPPVEVPAASEVPEPEAPGSTPLSERWWYAPVQHPPLSLFGGVLLRTNMAGARVGLGVRGVRRGPWTLGAQLTWTPERSFYIDTSPDLRRTEEQLDVALLGGGEIARGLRALTAFGISHRSYGQQGNPIDARQRPFVGLGLEVEAPVDVRLRPFLRSMLYHDVVVTEIVDEHGFKSELPGLQLSFVLGLRVSTRRWLDPTALSENRSRR